jgi:asparagine synthase (glutamine-hydrolysing)
MISHNGRYVMVYNGEVFNAPELAEQLKGLGAQFRGHSDTEVILEAISHWGINETVTKLIGMFAMGIWDTHKNTLTLVRDRFGVKPLYYGFIGQRWVFASELKSVRMFASQPLSFSAEALRSYAQRGYILGASSIYDGLYKLPPGGYVVLTSDTSEAQVQRYWHTETMITDGIRARDLETRPEPLILQSLETLLNDAVKRQLMADVPVGAFLSGGIDSSLVVALMQKHSAQQVRTFSIGFEDPSFDEAPYARAIAHHLQTNHTELYITDAQALETAQMIAHVYDEPFADSSQIPTYLVAKLAKEHVTVALSGDGGDEFFAGYNRYQLAAKLWRRMAWIPRLGRQALACGLKLLSPEHYDRWLPAMMPQLGDKIHKFAALLPAASAEAVYQSLVALPTDGSSILTAQPSPIDWPASTTGVLMDQFQAWDIMSYMPDDVLTKVDRASMAVGLEVRVPLLDHRLATMAWRLPLAYKYRDGKSKWALRQILASHLPSTLINRPKMGFGVPLAHWLRGPLRSWAEDYLSPSRLKYQGIFNEKIVYDQLWQQHQHGQRNWSAILWAVLMFQVWVEKHKEE